MYQGTIRLAEVQQQRAERNFQRFPDPARERFYDKLAGAWETFAEDIAEAEVRRKDGSSESTLLANIGTLSPAGAQRQGSWV